MNDSIVIFLNELKNKLVSRYKIIGISSELILELNLFPKNHDLAPFLQDVYGLEFKEYILRSRTLILARVVRHLDSSDAATIEEVKRRLYQYLITSSKDVNKIGPLNTSGTKKRNG